MNSSPMLSTAAKFFDIKELQTRKQSQWWKTSTVPSVSKSHHLYIAKGGDVGWVSTN